MKLNIRRMNEGDLQALHALLSDGEVMRYIEPPFTVEQTKRFLESAGLSEPPLVYAVDGEGGFIGYVIYHPYDEGSMEIGWLLKREEWGKGCAAALTERLIEMAFAEQKAVIIECAPAQIATKRIAEKFGFAYTGRRDGCDVYRLDAPRGATPH